jgi:hypothetical protein
MQDYHGDEEQTQYDLDQLREEYELSHADDWKGWATEEQLY